MATAATGTISATETTGVLPTTIKGIQPKDSNFNNSSSINNSPVPGGLPTRPNRPQKEEELAGTLLYRASWKTGRILQHFAVRSPHILIATAAAYLITHYYFNDPQQAIENATFVGTASASYCFVRPFFLETIPSSLLGSDQKIWRELINITYTVFTTLTLSSCVWGLKVPALKGLAIWATLFGSSMFLQKHYPAIDGNFKTIS
jgi:hypothetical protein